METAEKPRIDKYLWGIRLFKTRTQATDACNENKVKQNGQSVKPSGKVAIGDIYEIKTAARKYVVKVTGIIQKRVAYPDAIKNYEDITPVEEATVTPKLTASFHTGKRLSKTGKPTKKERRGLDDFFDNF